MCGELCTQRNLRVEDHESLPSVQGGGLITWSPSCWAPPHCLAQKGRARRSGVPVAGAQQGQTSSLLSVAVLAFEVSSQAGDLFPNRQKFPLALPEATRAGPDS